MSAVNLSASSEAFLGVILAIMLMITGIFFYFIARDAREQKKVLRERQQRDNEKK